MSDAFVEFRSVSKHFGGVQALDGVSLSVAKGACHALLGENGAGKSTLGKILAGIHQPDSGDLLLDGKPGRFRSPGEAREAGVGMVHQELAFVPELSVAENLSLGRSPRLLKAFLDRRALRLRAVELLEGLGLSGGEIDPDQPMRELSTAQEQMVQIAAAVGSGARVIVFDEPTSSLSEGEVRRFYGLMDKLKENGVTVLYVSHRLPEIFRLCDRISVLRDGRLAGSLDAGEATEGKLVRMMAGRELSLFKRGNEEVVQGPPVLELRGLSSPGRFQDISLTLHRGEILGLAGLVGAGRSELAKALFGLDPEARGHVELEGRPLKPGSVLEAMEAGLALVPEDRKREGLALDMSCRMNFSMAVLPRLSAGGFLRMGLEESLAREQFKRLDVKTPSLEAPVSSLSGGNQQKVLLAKWLAARGREGRVLIVDEPTRGVDVGAKAAIQTILADLAREGLALLLISSELPELLALSDRILVLRGGRLVAEVGRHEATEDLLLRHMAGVAA